MFIFIEIEGVELEFVVEGENRAATWHEPAEYAEVELVAGELPPDVSWGEVEARVLAADRELREEADLEGRLDALGAR